MPNCLKSILPPKPSKPWRGAKRRKALKTVEISDRLSRVISELSVIDAAIAEMRVGEPQAFGLYLILRRQIDIIEDIKTEIHPPLTKKG